MKKILNLGFAWPLVLVGVAVIFIAIIAYLAWQLPDRPPGGTWGKSQTPTPQATISSPDASREPNGSAETANWKVYRNEEYRFEVKYPPSWTFRLASQAFVPPRQDNFVLQNSNNAEQWISILINKDPQISNQGFSDVPVSGKFIGGLAAKVYQIPHPGEDVAVGKLGKYIGLWVEKGNKIYALIFYNTEIVGGVYDQILSTFRFE